MNSIREEPDRGAYRQFEEVCEIHMNRDFQYLRSAQNLDPEILGAIRMDLLAVTGNAAKPKLTPIMSAVEAMVTLSVSKGAIQDIPTVFVLLGWNGKESAILHYHSAVHWGPEEGMQGTGVFRSSLVAVVIRLLMELGCEHVSLQPQPPLFSREAEINAIFKNQDQDKLESFLKEFGNRVGVYPPVPQLMPTTYPYRSRGVAAAGFYELDPGAPWPSHNYPKKADEKAGFAKLLNYGCHLGL